MELRQLRSFVRVVEVGSISGAAQELGMAQSAVSQHISRLESEVSTRLLHRSPNGVTATEAGLAFFREAQLTLRHMQQASCVAQRARLGGSVSVGLPPTTASVLGMPFLMSMRERYPDVMVHLVEGLSGHLTSMLNSRQLDLAILFRDRVDARTQRRWHIEGVLEEDLYFIIARSSHPENLPSSMTMAELGNKSFILPSNPHGLRSTLDTLFERSKFHPQVVCEIDSLNLLTDAVLGGLGGTLQALSVLHRIADAQHRLHWSRISDEGFHRQNVLCSIPDDELPPPALAARVVLRQCARELVTGGRWPGARLVT